MEKHNCINCGSTNIMDVEYGTLDDEKISRIEAGLILHGGCAIQGLMQPYYCLDCDTRFDVQCTDIFMDHLKQIRYESKADEIIVDFHPEHLDVQINAVRRMIPYNKELKDTLRSSALEYWKTDNGNTWSIEVSCPGYFRESIQVQGSDDKPYTLKLFKAFIDKLTKTL